MLLPKGIKDYRPISVLEHLRKLFELVIFPHLTAKVEPLDMSKCGFGARRSTLDQAVTLQKVIRQFKVHHRAWT